MLIFGVLALSGAALAQDGIIQMQEQKIKAGLLYNFLKYTAWPPDTFDKKGSVSLRVCLFGGDPFDGFLHPLEGRTAQQIVISIRHIRNVAGLTRCQLVFVHRSQAERLETILEMLENQPILTVSDIDSFAARGGMVEFTTRNDRRIHIRINRQLAQASGLVIQDRLLRLAELVP